MNIEVTTRHTELAIISALHNESESIDYFYTRLKSVLDEIEGLNRWEIIFINDGSTDNSLKHLLKLKEKDQRVNFISLSRSFGYQNAIQAGLRTIQSKLYAIIDVDCEDPPELLKDFYKAITSENVALAYGIRSNRKEPGLITFFRSLFYRINKSIADTEVILWMAEFSMFTDTVKKAILTPKTTYIFLRTEMANIGFKRKGFNYIREARKFGKSHYNLWRMSIFAVGGLLASSTFPLRFVLYLSSAIGISFILFWVIFRYPLATQADIASIVILYFLIFSLPMLALYLARVYKNGVSRPLYVIDPAKTDINDNLKPKESSS